MKSLDHTDTSTYTLYKTLQQYAMIITVGNLQTWTVCYALLFLVEKVLVFI